MRAGAFSLLLASCGGAVTAASASGDAGAPPGPAHCPASGTASVTGTVDGVAFVPEDAVAFPMGATSFIEIGDYPNVCALLGTNDAKANSEVLTFIFDHGAITVGHFAASSVSAYFASLDGTCMASPGEYASDGTLSITHVDASSVAGTFELTFGAHQLTGSFAAPMFAQQGPWDGGVVCE